MKAQFYAGIASLVIAALLFIFGESQTTVPVAIVFTVLGSVLVAKARRAMAKPE